MAQAILAPKGQHQNAPQKKLPTFNQHAIPRHSVFYPQTNNPPSTAIPALAPIGFFISSHFYSLNHSSAKYGAGHTCPARAFHIKEAPPPCSQSDTCQATFSTNKPSSFPDKMHSSEQPTIHQTRLRVCPDRATSKRPTKEVAYLQPALHSSPLCILSSNHSSTKHAPRVCPERALSLHTRLSFFFYSLFEILSSNQPSIKHAPRVCPERAFFIPKKRRTLHPFIISQHFQPICHQTRPACLPQRAITLLSSIFLF